MGTYSNVAKGLKLVFVAEIVAIAAGVFSLIPFIGVIGSIATIICAILVLVGIKTAGADAEGYNKAFNLSIANIVISIVSVVIGLIPIIGSIIAVLLEAVSLVLAFLVVKHICITTSQLAENIGNSELAERGKKVLKWYKTVTIIGVIIGILNAIPVISIIVAVPAVILGIFEIIVSVLYLIFLYKSYNAFGA